LPRLAVAVGLCLGLAGCAGGFSLKKVDVDPSIVTSATGPEAPAAQAAGDETTIRNAVSAADIELLKGENVRWANPDTGARGTLSSLTETITGDRLCRDFTTSRENFDGVSLYQGRVCRVAPQIWRTERLEPK
jgi:hypothetical protein